MAKENTPPTRALEGNKTRISRTVHGFAYDPVHDEIVTPSPLAQAVLIFRGGATGEEAPIRVIQGPKTQILGLTNTLGVDPANNEILVANSIGSILVFDRESNGDVAPKRILQGPDTQIRTTTSLTAESPGQVRVHKDRMVVSSGGKLLIFDRTASGNTKPNAIIAGEKSGMVRIGNGYSSFQITDKGWIIGGCAGGAICAWNVNDNGDIPPRWKIPSQKLSGYLHTGIALNPVHKEIVLSAAGMSPPNARPTSGIMNALITYSWPEIY